MKITLRKATINDINFLHLLEQDAFSPIQQNTKEGLRHGLRSAAQEIFIAEEAKKEPVGAVVLIKYKKTLRIYSIAVLSKHQGKGIGDTIMTYVKTYASQNHYERILLEASITNEPLIAWYTARGFVKEGVLENYYAEGEDALKMEFTTGIESKGGKTNNLIVINKPFKLEVSNINAQVITVKEYINNSDYQNNADYRVFNLCSSYKYQSYGYYVSLLASARGQRVIPSIATIRDFKIHNVIQSAAHDIDEHINELLSKQTNNKFTLNIYFGQTTVKKYNSLAMRLYQLFEAPLFSVSFVKHEKWLIEDMKLLALKHVPLEDVESMQKFAYDYFNKKRHNYPKLTNYRYDLAILVNRNEENPPSNAEALERIKKAGNKKGVYVEFITKEDANRINEFDALFIRETTNVNHHTYELARLAYSEGLVVIDDPWSILRCSNKIYQNELFEKHKILKPKTVVLAKNFFDHKLMDSFNYPLVLKQPDSAFSLGVLKVENKDEALVALTRLFKKSDMVICQEFLYSDFDWRVGILDNQPFFACKYYMSKDHWQIYNWSGSEEDQAGDAETLQLEDVPEIILKTAQKAASLIGDGLYGVDLKMVDGKVYVVEVNDNPNIDFGIEDKVLKDGLYDRLLDSIINRIEIAKNIRKIKLGS